MSAALPLPEPAGPISAALIAQLSGRVQDLTRVRPGTADPLGLDLQLALVVSYELSCRGFAGVDAGWEWDVDLLALRARLERAFEDHLRGCVGDKPGEAVAELRHLDRSSDTCGIGSWQQAREYFVHSSPYHLKGADPLAWLAPRLAGRTKAEILASESGSPENTQLFVDLMAAAGLDDDYLGYLGAVPTESLAVVNLASMVGLHRSLRGAAIGHIAATTATTAGRSRLLVQTLGHLRAPAACARFYAAHLSVDPNRYTAAELIEEFLCAEPDLGADVVFGIRARTLLETRLAQHMTKSWTDGESALRQPLP